MENMIRGRRGTVRAALAMALLAGTLSLAPPRQSQAFTLLEREAWAFGPSVVEVGQLANLSTINWGDDAIRVELLLVDAQNRNTVFAHKEVTLAPGQGTTLPFVNPAAPANAAGDPTAVELCGIIAVLIGLRDEGRLTSLSSSVEIMDIGTGANRLHVSPTLITSVQLPAVQ